MSDDAPNAETRANTGPSNAKRRPIGRRMLLTAFPQRVSGEGQVAPQTNRNANEISELGYRLQLVLHRQVAPIGAPGSELSEAGREWGSAEGALPWPAGRVASRASGHWAARLANPGPGLVLGRVAAIARR